MQYRLRTLLFLMAIGPPMLAGGWFAYRFLLFYDLTRWEAAMIGTPYYVAAWTALIAFRGWLNRAATHTPLRLLCLLSCSISQSAASDDVWPRIGVRSYGPLGKLWGARLPGPYGPGY